MCSQTSLAWEIQNFFLWILSIYCSSFFFFFLLFLFPLSVFHLYFFLFRKQALHLHSLSSNGRFSFTLLQLQFIICNTWNISVLNSKYPSKLSFQRGSSDWSLLCQNAVSLYQISHCLIPTFTTANQMFRHSHSEKFYLPQHPNNNQNSVLDELFYSELYY